MILRDKGILFIHIPKSAGTTVEKTLGVKPFDWRVKNLVHLVGYDKENNLPLQHATPQQLIDFNYLTKDDFNKCESFAIIRNPFSRMVSAYFFMMKVSRVKDTFENYLTKSGRFRDQLLINGRYTHLTPQTDFIFFENGEQAVDTVLRFENLPHCLTEFLNQKFSMSLSDIPHEKRAGKRHYSRYYNSRTINLVSKIYEREIDLYGYKFEKRRSWIFW